MLETLFFSKLYFFQKFRCSKLLFFSMLETFDCSFCFFSMLETFDYCFCFFCANFVINAFIRFDRSNSFIFCLWGFCLCHTIKKCLRPQACPWRIRCPHRARHHESWWRGRSRDHGLWDGWHGARLRRPFFFRCQFYLSIHLFFWGLALWMKFLQIIQKSLQWTNGPSAFISFR